MKESFQKMKNNKYVCVLDIKMAGLEGGIPRIYLDISPSITARDYKDPLRVLIKEEYGRDKIR